MHKVKMLLTSLLLILSLYSCTRYIGYGVVLVPEEDSELKSGTLIKITKESRIRETWVYNSDVEEHIEIKKWRVKDYEKLEQAEEFIKNFSEYKDYYAISNRNSFSMRVKPDQYAALVYRLKNNQRVKVIGRSSEKDDSVGSWNEHWWNLITHDGIEGWSYGSYLSIYDNGKVIHTNVEEDGPEIDNFFKSVWRPYYFWDMQKSRNIDLNKFKSKFKLATDIDNREITISMPDHYETFKFTEFKRSGDNNYNLIGSNVQLDFSYGGAVTVIYSVDSKSYETTFINMADSLVNEIINTELTSRKIKYNEFLFQGPNFESKVYGKITFIDGNKFIWEDKENLLSRQLLTNNAGNSGTITFDNFLGDEIMGIYEGVITFDFGSRQELTFLYNFESGGLKLLYLPSKNIKAKVVETDDFYNPIQLFFTGQQ
ncbi:MAG: SH3 domain-containing protein [Spirochaetaceae bacterium]